MKLSRIICVVISAAIATTAYCQSKPTREVKMPTESNLGTKNTDYQSLNTGFFMAGEASAAWSLNSGKDNLGYTELDVTGGYRFNEFLRVGIGLGARYYIDNNNVRTVAHDWGMPLYLNARGNFIPTNYRNAVPFWSVDFGTTFPDGVMFRPSVGVRVGSERSAFVASIGYVGQNLRKFTINDGKHSFYSFINLKLGYEF